VSGIVQPYRQSRHFFGHSSSQRLACFPEFE